ncbi:MAG: DegQ family serine endoprotease [Solimicrobium sp.]|nr:DegQ family serine endoprotease [Solimicrobium sp.]
MNKLLSTLLAVSFAFVMPVAGFFPLTSSFAATPSFDFTDLVEKSSPAVVSIRTTEKIVINQTGNSDDEVHELFRRFFGVPVPQQPPGTAPKKRKPVPGNGSQEEVPRGIGSGFIISADGYVLTNAHVVEGADEVYIKLVDKREFKAKVIGIDKRTDVAVLKIDGSKLPSLTIGDSNKIKAGEWVVAIGSPFDFDNSVSAGIISSKARDTGDFLNLIQTDVAVNPGNSGGPLLNMNGEVIGINSQIYSRSGGFMGISFAIPIDEAMRVVDQLKSSGKVSRSRIGVRLSEVPKEVAESFGLKKGQGAFVNMVEPGLPADKAGIVAGDIVLEFNGQPVTKWTELSRIVANIKPGTKSSVTLWSKGKTRIVSLVTAEMEQEKPIKAKMKEPEVKSNLLGLNVVDLTEEQKSELKVASGVIIEEASGSAERAGLLPGDLITQLNNTEIRNAKQFNEVIAKLDPKKIAVVLVRRGDQSQFVPLRPAMAN